MGDFRIAELLANDAADGGEWPQSIAAQYEAARSPCRRAIVVLGMHRSGTSATAGVLNGLGVTAPKTLMNQNFDNPRGFFESEPIVRAHNELLASAGSVWDDWRELAPQWIASTAAQEHGRKIKALLVEEFGDEPLVLLKDPRICRFAKFTFSILDELGISPVVIIPVRSPLEVALSLKRRDDFALGKSILLWLRHVLEAEFHSRHLPRCFISYEDLLNNWRYCIDHIAAKTGLTWPERPDGYEAEIDGFLTPELRRERASQEELRAHAEITPLARETYDVLSDIAINGEAKKSLKQLDEIRNRFESACQIFEAALTAEELASEQLRQALQSQAAEVEQLRSQNAALIQQNNDLISERDAFAVGYNKLSDELDALARNRTNGATERGRLADAHQRLALDHSQHLQQRVGD